MSVFLLQEGNQKKNTICARILYVADSLEKILDHIYNTKYEAHEFVVTCSNREDQERRVFWINTKCFLSYYY